MQYGAVAECQRVDFDARLSQQVGRLAVVEHFGEPIPCFWRFDHVGGVSGEMFLEHEIFTERPDGGQPSRDGCRRPIVLLPISK